MKNKILLCLLLVFLSSLPYLNTLKGSFVYDDTEMVLKNKNVIGRTTLFQVFFDKQVMAFPGEIYRPIRDISYRINWLIGGDRPMVYHLTNVLLHATVTLSVYGLLLLLNVNAALSFITAAIFGVHPVHAESVAWIKGRDDLLFTLFYILSFSTYLLYERDIGRKRLQYYFVSILLFLASLFSKEMAITLPFAIALYQLIFKRLKPSALIPYLALAVLYMVLRSYVLEQVAQQEYWGGGMVPTLLTTTKGFAQYVRLSFFPVNLCADYFSFPVSKGFDLQVLSALALLAFTLVCLYRTKDQFIKWGGLFFFLALLPVSNIIPIKIVIAERFLYLPLLGFCIVMVSLVSNALVEKNYTYAVFGIIIVLLFTLAAKRASVWKDEFSLWSDTLRKAPSNARAHYGIGTAYAARGMLEEAIKEYKESIRLAPYYPDPFNALGLAYQRLGMDKEAKEAMAGYSNTGGLILYYEKGMVRDSIALYSKALDIDPSHRDARYNLALLYHEQGMVAEAMKEYNEILKRYPDDYDALNGLGLAYFQKGMFREALVLYKKGLKFDPASAASYNNIGMVYAVTGQAVEAEKWFRRALMVDPMSAEAYYNLGFMHQNLGRSSEAAGYYRKVLEINPDYKEAIKKLSEIERSQ